MQRTAPITLALAGLAWVGCASDAPKRKCDGEVFFVGVKCHEVASTAPTAPSGTEPGPSSQPSPRSGEPGPSSQPSREPGPSSQPSPHAALPAPAPKPAPKPTPAPTPTPAPAVTAPAQDATPPEVNVVYFEPDSARITVDARVVLDSIVEYLNAAPKEAVTLHGFVDPTGSAARNNELRRDRAQAVRKFLVDAGVAADRVVLPADFARDTPADFPRDRYWSLRKVSVDYSEHAREIARASMEAADREAEAEAKPEPKPERKPDKPAKRTESPTATVAANEPKLERVDILYWKSVNHALFILAKQLGYFEGEGLDVRLHNSNRIEASQISLALAESSAILGKSAGSVEASQLGKRKYFMGAVCPYGLHEELAKNVPLVQIGSMLQEPITLVMKKDLAEKLKRDLGAFAGRSVGKQQDMPSAIDYMELFTHVLENRKVKYSSKIYKDRNALEAAFYRGEVDAIASTPPYDVNILEHDPSLGVFELRSLYPQMTCCRQVVTREQLRDKKTRNQYVRFERAVIRAHKYYKEHLLEASELVAKNLQMKPAVVRQIFLRPAYTLDPNPNTKGSIAFYDVIKGDVGKQDFREAVDTSVYEEALFSLAKANPKDEYFVRAVRDYKLTN